MKRVITKEARVVQITQGARASDIDASVQMAIRSLQAQIQSFYKLITDLKKTDNTGTTSEGVFANSSDMATVAVLTNRSGAGRSLGDVVVYDTANSRSFTVTTAAGDAAVAGVVYSDSPDGTSPGIADGASGNVCIGGFAYVNADAGPGAIAVGDYLISYSTPGYARRAENREDGGVFAMALEPLASGTGKIAAIIETAALVNSEAILALKNFDYSLFEREGCYVPHYDTDGSATGFSGYVTSATLWADAAMSKLAGHWTYRYSANGVLASAVHSYYGMDGAALGSVRRAIEYQEDRLEKIISEIS